MHTSSFSISKWMQFRFFCLVQNFESWFIWATPFTEYWSYYFEKDLGLVLKDRCYKFCIEKNVLSEYTQYTDCLTTQTYHYGIILINSKLRSYYGLHTSARSCALPMPLTLFICLKSRVINNSLFLCNQRMFTLNLMRIQ